MSTDTVEERWAAAVDVRDLFGYRHAFFRVSSLHCERRLESLSPLKEDVNKFR